MSSLATTNELRTPLFPPLSIPALLLAPASHCHHSSSHTHQSLHQSTYSNHHVGHAIQCQGHWSRCSQDWTHWRVTNAGCRVRKRLPRVSASNHHCNYDGEYDWLHSRCIYMTVKYCTLTLIQYIATLVNMWPRNFLFWYSNPFMEGGWGGEVRQNPLKKFEDPMQLKKILTPLGWGPSLTSQISQV